MICTLCGCSGHLAKDCKRQPRVTRKNWTEADDAIMRERYANTPTKALMPLLNASERAIYARATLLGLKKSAEYLATEAAGRLGHGKGKHCRFHKGQTPWNKGRAFDSGGRSHETRFKPGQKPHTWNPIGHERVTKDGYRERKITDTGITRQDYVGLHTLLWREFHGDVPAQAMRLFSVTGTNKTSPSTTWSASAVQN